MLLPAETPWAGRQARARPRAALLISWRASPRPRRPDGPRGRQALAECSQNGPPRAPGCWPARPPAHPPGSAAHAATALTGSIKRRARSGLHQGKEERLSDRPKRKSRHTGRPCQAPLPPAAGPATVDGCRMRLMRRSWHAPARNRELPQREGCASCHLVREEILSGARRQARLHPGPVCRRARHGAHPEKEPTPAPGPAQGWGAAAGHGASAVGGYQARTPARGRPRLPRAGRRPRGPA